MDLEERDGLKATWQRLELEMALIVEELIEAEVNEALGAPKIAATITDVGATPLSLLLPSMSPSVLQPAPNVVQAILRGPLASTSTESVTPRAATIHPEAIAPVSAAVDLATVTVSATASSHAFTTKPTSVVSQPQLVDPPNAIQDTSPGPLGGASIKMLVTEVPNTKTPNGPPLDISQPVAPMSLPHVSSPDDLSCTALSTPNPIPGVIIPNSLCQPDPPLIGTPAAASNCNPDTESLLSEPHVDPPSGITSLDSLSRSDSVVQVGNQQEEEPHGTPIGAGTGRDGPELQSKDVMAGNPIAAEMRTESVELQSKEAEDVVMEDLLVAPLGVAEMEVMEDMLLKGSMDSLEDKSGLAYALGLMPMAVDVSMPVPQFPLNLDDATARRSAIIPTRPNEDPKFFRDVEKTLNRLIEAEGDLEDAEQEEDRLNDEEGANDGQRFDAMMTVRRKEARVAEASRLHAKACHLRKTMFEISVLERRLAEAAELISKEKEGTESWDNLAGQRVLLAQQLKELKEAEGVEDGSVGKVTYNLEEMDLEKKIGMLHAFTDLLALTL